MKSVVAIHNSVNERAWREVMAWEALHASECATPRLKKFQGRPSDYSPKARLLNTLVRVQFGVSFTFLLLRLTFLFAHLIRDLHSPLTGMTGLWIDAVGRSGM